VTRHCWWCAGWRWHVWPYI